jgi:hypothetical protein
MGTQLDTSEAAQYAAQITGLPAALTQALIQEEGTITNGWNNPFDLDYTGAQEAVTGGVITANSVLGQGGAQGNIAKFDSTTTGVEAWAYVINNDPLYANLRSAISNPNSTIAQLVAAFGSAYSGGSKTWAPNVISIANNLLGSGITTQPQMTANPPTSNTPIPGNSISSLFGTTGQSLVGAIPAPVTAAFSSTTNALSGIADAAATAAQDTGQFAQDIQAIGTFFQSPGLWTRIVLGGLGALLAIVGLILFAVSFIPKASVPAVVPV